MEYKVSEVPALAAGFLLFGSDWNKMDEGPSVFWSLSYSESVLSLALKVRQILNL